ncbi:alpha/beta hydrolase [Nocardia sp. NBC_01499]|uniref:alpha/beta fold hydrolase n=1 Tax=Nocardia sp. NBC_01499 TaxID=2903597 RepID=UPI003867E8C2
MRSWLARRYQDRATQPIRQALAEIHPAHGYGAVSWPTLIVADSMDKVSPVSTARALHDQPLCSRLELVGQGGHHLPRRIPEIVAAKIGNFVESLD